jgi:hypothetical protein
MTSTAPASISTLRHAVNGNPYRPNAEVAQYENIYLLCYLRGPAGIIVALAEQIG